MYQIFIIILSGRPINHPRFVDKISKVQEGQAIWLAKVTELKGGVRAIPTWMTTERVLSEDISRKFPENTSILICRKDL